MSRFKVGDVVLLPKNDSFSQRGLAILIKRVRVPFRNETKWHVTYLLEFVRGWRGLHIIKESTLTKVIWTFTGYVDKPCRVLK